MANKPAKVKNNIKPRPNSEYGYIGLALFGDDKQELIETINAAELPYSSLNHFLRTAINTQLRAHNIDFQIAEN